MSETLEATVARIDERTAGMEVILADLKNDHRLAAARMTAVEQALAVRQAIEDKGDKSRENRIKVYLALAAGAAGMMSQIIHYLFSKLTGVVY